MLPGFVGHSDIHVIFYRSRTVHSVHCCTAVCHRTLCQQLNTDSTVSSTEKSEMADVTGRWDLYDSEGFEDYLKAVGKFFILMLLDFELSYVYYTVRT